MSYRDPEVQAWVKEAAESYDPWAYIYALVDAGILVGARPGVKGLRWVYVKPER